MADSENNGVLSGAEVAQQVMPAKSAQQQEHKTATSAMELAHQATEVSTDSQEFDFTQVNNIFAEFGATLTIGYCAICSCAVGHRSFPPWPVR